MLTMKEIGERIRERRKDLDWTQGQLAGKVGASPGAVGQWERGDTLPRGGRIEAIAKALDVTETWLLTGETTSIVPKSATESPSIRIEGLVGTGLWQEDGSSVAGGRPRAIPMTKGLRYPNARLVAFEVRGDDFSKSFPLLRDIYTVSIEETGHSIAEGDWVLVETARNGMIERSAWCVTRGPRGFFLESESEIRRDATRIELSEIETDPNRRLAWLCDQFVGTF